MTRSELIDALAHRFPKQMKADADMAVAEILRAIGQTLVEDVALRFVVSARLH